MFLPIVKFFLFMFTEEILLNKVYSQIILSNLYLKLIFFSLQNISSRILYLNLIRRAKQSSVKN